MEGGGGESKGKNGLVGTRLSIDKEHPFRQSAESAELLYAVFVCFAHFLGTGDGSQCGTRQRALGIARNVCVVGIPISCRGSRMEGMALSTLGPRRARATFTHFERSHTEIDSSFLSPQHAQ